MVPRDRSAPSLNGTPEAVASSRSTSDELLHYFKRIEDAWKTAEEKLAATRVPIDVRVKVGDGPICDDDGGQLGTYANYLSYCKTKGLRRICLVTHQYLYNCPGPDAEIKPIAECPVDVRIGMFNEFARLYAEAQSVAKSYVPKLKEAVEKFEVDLQWLDLL